MEKENNVQIPDEKALHQQFLEELKRSLHISEPIPGLLEETREQLPDLGRWIKA